MVPGDAADRLRAFVKKNPKGTARDAAQALGVSRQRIYHLCKEIGIRLSVPPNVPGTRLATGLPLPRVRTGGVSIAVNHTICGTISELLAAADLMARGYKVYTPIARQKCHDLIAVAPDGRLVTFEVRSGRRRATGAGFTFVQPQRGKSDVIAVVLTGDPVEYIPALPVE